MKCCYIYPQMSDLDPDKEPFHAAGDRCWKEAIYEIHGESHLLHDNTLACEDHVGVLLGTPIDAPRENARWTVMLIGISAPNPLRSSRVSV